MGSGVRAFGSGQLKTLWGLADADVKERIVAAHHAAAADVIEFFKREVAATRAGIADSDGAVAQVNVAGVAAVAYDHFDSRAGDPQLHTHVVISNKVLTVMDDRWRSLDGRPVFASRRGLSEHYNALLADRTREIELKKDELITEYVVTYGRMPSARTIVALRAQATLATRPPKEIRSLVDLTAEWRRRAAAKLAKEASTWASSLTKQPKLPLSVHDVPLPVIEAVAADVVAAAGGLEPLEPDGRGIETDIGVLPMTRHVECVALLEKTG